VPSATTIEDLRRDLKPLWETGGFKLIVLFGSMAAGRETKDSDLDLAFLPKAAMDEMAVCSEVIRMTHWNNVDVVDLRRADPVLGMQVQVAKGGIALFSERSTEFTEFRSLAFRKFIDSGKLRVAQRRALDATLTRSLKRNALLLDQANDGIFFAGLDGRIREANQRADAMYGYGPGGLIGRHVSEIVAEEGREAYAEQLATLLRDGQFVGETIHVNALGARFPVESSARRVEAEGQVEMVALVRDITERKAADARIARLNQVLRTLREIDEMILREHDPARVRSEACRILVEQGGVAIAWIGVAEPDGCIRPVAWAGALGELITNVQVRWDDTPEGQGPAGTAIREDRTVTVGDAATDERAAAWRAMLARYGVRAMVSVPIRRSATERDVLAVQAMAPDALDADVVALLEELAGDLGYALQALGEREARQAAEHRLAAFFESSLFGTTVGRSVAETPNHLPSVAAYWSTEVDGSRRPEPMSSGVPSEIAGNLP
jgi:PAS domain S-box-containing protein